MRSTRASSWLVGFLAILAGGCGDSAPTEVATPPPAVTVSEPVIEEITDFDTYEGRIEATQTVDVRPRVSGYIVEVNFQDGDEVEAGKVLFHIDPEPFKAELLAAQGGLDSIEARVKRLETDKKRVDRLIVTGGISREEYDKVTGDLAEAKAQKSSAKARVQTAQLNLDYATIAAPIAGKVGKANFTVGNLVVADSTKPLTTIVALDPMYVSFNVDEGALLRYQRADRKEKEKGEKLPPLRERKIPVEVGLEGEEGYPHKDGLIVFANIKVDASTGTINVRAEIPNKRRIFTPGLRARVRVPVSEPYKSILVYEAAIGTDQKGKYLYVVDSQGRVQRRDVKLGALRGELRVITKGLKADEMVIVTGLLGVRPGMTVTTTKAKMPGAHAR